MGCATVNGSCWPARPSRLSWAPAVTALSKAQPRSSRSVNCGAWAADPIRRRCPSMREVTGPSSVWNCLRSSRHASTPSSRTAPADTVATFASVRIKIPAKPPLRVFAMLHQRKSGSSAARPGCSPPTPPPDQSALGSRSNGAHLRVVGRFSCSGGRNRGFGWPPLRPGGAASRCESRTGRFS